MSLVGSLRRRDTAKTKRMINFLKAINAASGMMVRQNEDITFDKHIKAAKGKIWIRCLVSKERNPSP